ncbi:MAG: hypothetical protein ACM359_14110 [Bacillota bacterium]
MPTQRDVSVPLFNDTYKGPRWTYGLSHRPLGFFNQPKGYIIHSDRKHPRFMFGTVDYPFELPAEEVSAFQLVRVA